VVGGWWVGGEAIGFWLLAIGWVGRLLAFGFWLLAGWEGYWLLAFGFWLGGEAIGFWLLAIGWVGRLLAFGFSPKVFGVGWVCGLIMGLVVECGVGVGLMYSKLWGMIFFC